MTRGRIAIITDDKVFTSIEFNGDMYMPKKTCCGYGKTVTNGLKRVEDMADYYCFVAKFNKENHHYNDFENIIYQLPSDSLNFKYSYFDNWFSDYVYIKNIGKNSRTIYAENGAYELPSGAIARLYFGRLQKISI